MNTATMAFVILTVFLVSREIVCWYWKLNEILTVLKSIDNKLDKETHRP